MEKAFLLLLFTQLLFSQETAIDRLFLEGEKAFNDKNFALAKQKYANAIQLDSLNKDAWYNLASSELQLGEKEIACEYYYKVYLLHGYSLKEIKEHCPNFRNGTLLWLDEVDEMPKFVYNEKEFALIDNKTLTPKYLDVLMKEFRKSSLLREKTKGKTYYVVFHINKLGIFDGEIGKVGTKDADVEILKMEILRILRNTITFIPAKNKGKAVEYWDVIALPIDFGKL